MDTPHGAGAVEGGFLDHALDLVHPPFWWWAFAVGLGIGQPGIELQMIVIVGGYVVGRILEGIFLAAFGMEMFTWRPFDAFFRGLKEGGFDGIATYEMCSPLRGGGSLENLDRCASAYLEWMRGKGLANSS